jgi:hypothetical protein
MTPMQDFHPQTATKIGRKETGNMNERRGMSLTSETSKRSTTIAETSKH